VGAGVRTTWIPNAGFDPFADNNHLTQFSLNGMRTVLNNHPTQLALGLTWEYGERQSTARGARSSLDVHRLGGVVEGRYLFGSDVYLMLKLVPQAIHTKATLSDPSAPADLIDGQWRFGLDATAGAAWAPLRTMNAKALRNVWLSGEFGYGWSTSNRLLLKPDLDDSDPRSKVTLELGSLALRGPMMRIMLAAAF
jgi:hypothetical protein